MARVAELEARVRTLEDALRGAAHDFNNVLTVIRAATSLLGAEVPPDHPSRDLLDEIAEAEGRGSSLTKQLLAFIRREVPRTRILDPADVIGEPHEPPRRRVEPPRGPEHHGREATRGGGEAGTVLLVEDDLAVRHVVAQLLRKRGFQVLEATEARSAVELLATHRGPIRLVLVDVVLPGASGATVAPHVKLHHPEAQLLYMSGYGGDTLHRAGLSGDGFAFIQKPFELGALLTKIAEILGLDSPPRPASST